MTQLFVLLRFNLDAGVGGCYLVKMIKQLFCSVSITSLRDSHWM